MINKTLSLLVMIILLNFGLNGCKDKSVEPEIKESNTKLETETEIEIEKEQENNQIKPEADKKDTIESKLSSPLRPKEEIEFGKVYTDTVNFTSFDDNTDYWYFLAQKNKDTIQIIYHSDMEISKLVKGDEIVIEWEMKRLQEAGDDDITYVKPYLISFRKIDNTSSSDVAHNIKNTFVISCGSGCAMTYSESKIVSNSNDKEVTFRVEMYINEKLSDEYYQTYVYTCDTSNRGAQINLKEDTNYKIEDEHPQVQEKLKSYIPQLCNNYFF